MSDRDERLPKWARDELQMLRRNCASLQAQLNAGVIGDHPVTNIHVQPPGDLMGGYVPSAFRDVRLMMGDHWSNFIDFRMDTRETTGERCAYLHSGFSTLIVQPRAGNAILLRTSR